MSSSESIYPKIKLLTAINYQTWRDNIEFILREKGLWKLVNGNEVKPSIPQTSEPETASTAIAGSTSTVAAEITEWEKKADQAIGIIGRLMSENLKHHIRSHLEDPAAAWKHLNDTFGKNTAANIGRLRKEFSSIKYVSSKSMADHLERMEQLAHDIGQAERQLTDSELAVAMLQSMPSDYTVTVQGIEAADKGTDPIYVYTKLIDEEQRRNSETPQNSSNNKSDKALRAQDRISKPGEKRKCFKCHKIGHLSRNCKSKDSDDKKGKEGGKEGGKGSYPPCGTCKKTNHPEDRCIYKKIYEQARADMTAEAKAANTQTWGISPKLD